MYNYAPAQENEWFMNEIAFTVLQVTLAVIYVVYTCVIKRKICARLKLHSLFYMLYIRTCSQ